MTEPHYASASERNSEPILGVLRHEFKDTRKVFEIGSGTGQHAVYFAEALPHLIWQTSDLEESHTWIERRIGDSKLNNVLPPLVLDVRVAVSKFGRYDAVYSCNTMHIMDFGAVQKMLPLLGEMLQRGGLFCYYGPFVRNDRFSTPSNAQFDAGLRARGQGMGIRALEVVDDLASAVGLERQRVYAMPANNLLVIWLKVE